MCVIFFSLGSLFSLAILVSSNPHEYDVIIVGAGVSGIATASTLIKNRVRNIAVLEASNRIGGRLSDVQVSGYHYEMGAETFHGVKDSAGDFLIDLGLGQYIDDADDDLSENELICTSITHGGKLLDANIVNELSRMVFINDTILEDIKYNSLFAWLLPRVWVRLADPKLNLEADQVPIYWYILEKWVERGFGPMAHLGIRGMPLIYKLKAFSGLKIPNYFLLHAMMGTFPVNSTDIGLQEKIIYNQTVAKIEWGDWGVKLTSRQGSEDVAYHAARVVITVPLGVLKKHAISFYPPLTTSHQTAIKTIGFHVVDKVILIFSENANLTDLRNTFSDVPIMFSYSKEKLRSLTKQIQTHSWIIGLNEWIGDFSSNQPRLEATLSGDDALSNKYQTIAKSQQISLELDHDLRVLLHDMLPWVYIPEFKRIVGSNWGTDPHFYGSFPYPSLASELKNISFNELATPLRDQNQKAVVMFAGDATSSTQFGTVSGALESGWREAYRILGDF